MGIIIKYANGKGTLAVRNPAPSSREKRLLERLTHIFGAREDFPLLRELVPYLAHVELLDEKGRPLRMGPEEMPVVHYAPGAPSRLTVSIKGRKDFTPLEDFALIENELVPVSLVKGTLSQLVAFCQEPSPKDELPLRLSLLFSGFDGFKFSGLRTESAGRLRARSALFIEKVDELFDLYLRLGFVVSGFPAPLPEGLEKLVEVKDQVCGSIVSKVKTWPRNTGVSRVC